MRLVTFSPTAATAPRAGVRVGHRVLDIEAASRVDGEPLPNAMKLLLREGRGAFSRVQALAKAAQSTPGRFSGAMYEEGAIRFLPPIPDPDQLLCVGRGEQELARSAKPPPTLVGHNAKVAKGAAPRLDCEPALVFVIGRRAHGVDADLEIEDYVAGVTLLNDLSDRSANDAPGYGPMGPEIVTLDEIADPYDLWITCSVNGEERLRANSGEHRWQIGDLLEHFSRGAAVEPGDMISTAPGQANPLLTVKPGDVVECAIEGLTTLRTTIVSG